ncbi:MFS transporter, partial [Hansschlegelia beijingensis]
MTAAAPVPDDGARWRVLGLVCLALVLSMTTWFSATAVTPELIAAWGLSPADASWLTNMVQLGFVAGALGSSLVNLPDIVAPRKLMAASAALAALANL